MTGEAYLFVDSPAHGKFHSRIDVEDAEKVAEHIWTVQMASNNRVYFRTRSPKPDGTQGVLGIHRFIMNAPDDLMVDHINPSDTLDNRRSNLRLATRQQNAWNSRSQSGGSKYKGVHWCKRENKWVARIMINGKKKLVGYFYSETEAAHAYDAAALEHFGEFALLNFPIPIAIAA